MKHLVSLNSTVYIGMLHFMYAATSMSSFLRLIKVENKAKKYFIHSLIQQQQKMLEYYVPGNIPGEIC